MNRSPVPALTTRLLHAGLAIGVTMQLLLSTFMEKPRPGAARKLLQSLGFEAHEAVGLSLLVVMIVWFLWLFLRRHEPGPQELYPWFRAQRRRALHEGGCRLLAEARQWRIVGEDDVRPLAQAVHGLGALCALGMALSGALVWLAMSPSGALPVWASVVLDLHQGAASLMWIYLVGHAGMALLHQWRGDSVLGRMFSLRRPR